MNVTHTELFIFLYNTTYINYIINNNGHVIDNKKYI